MKRRGVLVLVGVAILSVLIPALATWPARRAKGWKQDLLDRLSTANRVRIHHEGPCCRGVGLGSVVAELEGRERVCAALDCIEFEPSWDILGESYCACCGAPSLEFLCGEESLGEISVHHGQKLRIQFGRGGDLRLTAQSQTRLVAWLEREGILEPGDSANSVKGLESRAEREARSQSDSDELEALAATGKDLSWAHALTHRFVASERSALERLLQDVRRARYEVGEIEREEDPQNEPLWRANVIAYVVPDRQTVLRESEAMARLAKLRKVKYVGWKIP